jgi:long-chain fatty acid transport protein
LSINTPFGLVTQNPNVSTGRFYGLTSKVASIDVAPTIAYQVNDWLSVGAGVRVMNFKVRLTSATGILEGDDVAFGFTGGVTLKPWKGGEIGVGYRSSVSPKLSGTITTSSVTDISSNMKLPEQITIGLRHQLTNDFTVLLGYEWTHWGSFTRFPVLTTSGATATTLYFDYRDSWYASLGGEYKWNKDLTLRAGLGFEKSPITDAIRSVRLPDSDRTWATLGASYSLNEKLTLDASYAHLFAKSGSINVVAGNPSLITPTAGALAGVPLPFVGSTKGHVDIVSLSMTYRFDAPTPSTRLPGKVTK